MTSKEASVKAWNQHCQEWRNTEESEMYRALYGEDAVTQRSFVNIGAGTFRHPAWTNVDFDSTWYTYPSELIDIHWDATQREPIRLPDNSVDLAYTSHTIEHLNNDDDAFLFREAFRLLKPGGLLRVTCPDIQWYFERYLAQDAYVFPGYASLGLYYEDVADLFVAEFATMVTRGRQKYMKEKGYWELFLKEGITVPQPIQAGELEKLLQTDGLEGTLNQIVDRINPAVHTYLLGGHVNWWNGGKVSQQLKTAGFMDIRQSAYGQSQSPVMRNFQHFDNSIPQNSLFVEARKPIASTEELPIE